ncbi:MAG: ROK family protein [Spirochaetota bacterium]
MQRDALAAIDIGAGQGTRVALFDNPATVVGERYFSLSDYGVSFESFVGRLRHEVEALLAENGNRELRSIGIATPGVLRRDGSFKWVQNIPFLEGHNLKEELSRSFGVRAGVANDADAGALAEWSVLRIDLLYWVFGGGWGGAWVSKEGELMFPSTDWDGRDSSLHYTNEPGVSIPLEKIVLQELFTEIGASYDRLERILDEEFGEDDEHRLGPGGDPESLRAEIILSGPGRCRLFRAIVGNDDFYERFLDIHETKEMSDPAVAGKHISKLSSMRVEPAVNTDRLYGKILARATGTMLKAAREDGLPEGIPICLGGKPSYALPYFGPSAQRMLGKMGMMNYLRPSIVDERGLNANLVGAAVVADHAERLGRTVATRASGDMGHEPAEMR